MYFTETEFNNHENIDCITQDYKPIMMYIHYINETYIISLANVNNASLWRHDPGYSHKMIK